MSESDYPYLLVLVEGPSEASNGDRETGPRGIVQSILAYVFGDEVAGKVRIDYWRRTPRSPLRTSPDERRLCARARQVMHAIKLADATTAYGAVLLVDNDHLYERGRSRRLDELQEGVDSSGLSDRAAIGVAQEMIEAWLLADPALLRLPLPAGKRCEELWGDKHEPASNYPKHVLSRCVLAPGRVSYIEAIEAWNVVRARPHAVSLDRFVHELERLASRQGAL